MMSAPNAPVSKELPPPPPLDPFAALLSFLIPGLGQVFQGRVAKGLLFFICLYGLFFYGMWLGKMKNVWLPDVSKEAPVDVPLIQWRLEGFAKTVYYRPHFMGQFFIGIAAWPALMQNSLYETEEEEGRVLPKATIFGHYMQALPEKDLNDLQRAENKRWDLGWVYTVIAGLLNILVIYDALAGPMIRDEHLSETRDPNKPVIPADEPTSIARGRTP